MDKEVLHWHCIFSFAVSCIAIKFIGQCPKRYKNMCLFFGISGPEKSGRTPRFYPKIWVETRCIFFVVDRVPATGMVVCQARVPTTGTWETGVLVTGTGDIWVPVAETFQAAGSMHNVGLGQIIPWNIVSLFRLHWIGFMLCHSAIYLP